MACREKGKAASVKKAGKVAAEGVSYAAVVNGVGVVIEVNSQTDFVAKNEIFQGFVNWPLWWRSRTPLMWRP